MFYLYYAHTYLIVLLNLFVFSSLIDNTYYIPKYNYGCLYIEIRIVIIEEISCTVLHIYIY